MAASKAGRSTARQRDENLAIAGLLYDLATAYAPSPRSLGYKRAARTIRAFPHFLSKLTEEETLAIPSIGPATYRVVREYLSLGRSPAVERAIEETGQEKAVRDRRRFRANFLSNAMVRRVLGARKKGVVAPVDHHADFQMHSVASDGVDSLATMAIACQERGYNCACMTDHSHGLKIAGGMSAATMRKQGKEIDALNTRYRGEFRFFKGAEANILADGSLDLSVEERRELDIVVASPHSVLRKARDQTDRMLTAVALPAVHILGHPRGRVFNLRAGIVADWPLVFERAAESGVAIELDGDSSRQDLDHVLAKLAMKAGCLFALDSDAHAADQLGMVDFAIAHARLAGIPAERIINCWEPDRIAEWARLRSA